MKPETQAPGADPVSGAQMRSQGLIVVHPATGEILDLAHATTDTLADWRLELVETKRKLDALASDLDVEMARRLDLEATRSARVGDYELEVQAPTFVEYDVPRLTIALEALVTDGRISRGAAERAVKREVTYRPVQRDLNQLLAHADPEVRESVARCRSDVTRTRRRVTVRRAH